ncbi:MAG: TAXI family TRAP transporter solute-binding subunit [Syntrophorhabdaceae bacterium]|nr:TAXI family TRAP transporter solute-binding subunit [Syntrophorhabdaceae bacterium]
MKFRLLFIGVSICLLIFSLAVRETGAAPQEIHMGTSTVGGIYYSIGVPIAQVVNKYLPEVHITPEITSGSTENIRLLAQGKLQLGLTVPFKTVEAMNGLPPFNQKIPLRAVFRTVPVVNLFVVLANSNIKTMEDLKGKRVNLGQPGGLDENALGILEAYGITKKDIKWSVQGVAQGVEGLKDGKFDAVITTVPLINQLKATHDIRILFPDEAHIDKMAAKVKGWSKWLMPPGTIKGIDKPIYVPDFGSQLSCMENMSADLVYKITKTSIERLDELRAMFAPYRDVTKELAASPVGVPLHPGALKYFKEAGIIK